MSIFSNITFNLNNLFTNTFNIIAKSSKQKKEKKEEKDKLKQQKLQDEKSFKPQSVIKLLNNDTALREKMLQTHLYIFLEHLRNNDTLYNKAMRKNFNVTRVFYNALSMLFNIDIESIYNEILPEHKGKDYSYSDILKLAISNALDEYINTEKQSLATNSTLTDDVYDDNNYSEQNGASSDEDSINKHLSQLFSEYIYNPAIGATLGLPNVNANYKTDFKDNYVLKYYTQGVGNAFNTISKAPLTFFNENEANTVLLTTLFGSKFGASPDNSSLVSKFFNAVQLSNITYEDLYNYLFEHAMYSDNQAAYITGRKKYLLVDSFFKKILNTEAAKYKSSDLSSVTVDGVDLDTIYESNIKDFLSMFNLSKITQNESDAALIEKFSASVGLIKSTDKSINPAHLPKVTLTENHTESDLENAIKEFKTTLDGLSGDISTYKNLDDDLVKLKAKLDKIGPHNVKNKETLQERYSSLEEKLHTTHDKISSVRALLLSVCAELFKAYFLNSNGHYSSHNVLRAYYNSSAIDSAFSPYLESNEDDHDYTPKSDAFAPNKSYLATTMYDSFSDDADDADDADDVGGDGDELASLRDAEELFSNFGNINSTRPYSTAITSSMDERKSSVDLLLDSLDTNYSTFSNIIDTIRNRIHYKVAELQTSASSETYKYLNDPSKNFAEARAFESLFNTCVSKLSTAFEKNTTISKDIEKQIKIHLDAIYKIKSDIKKQQAIHKKYNTILKLLYKKNTSTISVEDFLSKKYNPKFDEIYTLGENYVKALNDNNSTLLDNLRISYSQKTLDNAASVYKTSSEVNSTLETIQNQQANKDKELKKHISTDSVKKALQSLLLDCNTKISEDKTKILKIQNEVSTKTIGIIQKKVESIFDNTINEINAANSIAGKPTITISNDSKQALRDELFSKFQYIINNTTFIFNNNNTNSKKLDPTNENNEHDKKSIEHFIQNTLQYNLDGINRTSDFCITYPLYQQKRIDIVEALAQEDSKSQENIDKLKNTHNLNNLSTEERQSLEADKKSVELAQKNKNTLSIIKDKILYLINNNNANNIKVDANLDTIRFLTEYFNKYTPEDINLHLSTHEKSLLDLYVPYNNTKLSGFINNPMTYIHSLRKFRNGDTVIKNIIKDTHLGFLKNFNSDSVFRDSVFKDLLPIVNSQFKKANMTPIISASDLIKDIITILNDNNYTTNTLNFVNLDLTDDLIYKNYLLLSTYLQFFINKNNNKDKFKSFYKTAPQKPETVNTLPADCRLILLGNKNRSALPNKIVSDALDTYKNATDFKNKKIEMYDKAREFFYILHQGASAVGNDAFFDDKIKLTLEDVEKYKALAEKLTKNTDLYKIIAENYSLISDYLENIQNLCQNTINTAYKNVVSSLYSTETTFNNKIDRHVKDEEEKILTSATEDKSIISHNPLNDSDFTIYRRIKNTFNKLNGLFNTMEKQNLSPTAIASLVKDIVEFNRLNTLYFFFSSDRGSQPFDTNNEVLQAFLEVGNKALQDKRIHKEQLSSTMLHIEYVSTCYITAKLAEILGLSINAETVTDTPSEDIINNNAMSYLSKHSLSSLRGNLFMFRGIKKKGDKTEDIRGTLIDLLDNNAIVDSNISSSYIKSKLDLYIISQKTAVLLKNTLTSVKLKEPQISDVQDNLRSLLSPTNQTTPTNIMDPNHNIGANEKKFVDDIDNIDNNTLNTTGTIIFNNSCLHIIADNKTPFLNKTNLGVEDNDAAAYNSPTTLNYKQEQHDVESSEDGSFISDRVNKPTTDNDNTKTYDKESSARICLILSNLYRTRKDIFNMLLNDMNNSYVSDVDLKDVYRFIKTLPSFNWKFTDTTEALGINHSVMQRKLDSVIAPVLQDYNLLDKKQ